MKQVQSIPEKKKKKKLSTGQIVLAAVMLLFVLVCTLPFVNVIAVSFSSKSAILRGAVSFWPVEFSTKAYEAIFKDSSMFPFRRTLAIRTRSRWNGCPSPAGRRARSCPVSSRAALPPTCA